VDTQALRTPSSSKLVQEGQSDLGEFERVAPVESADRYPAGAFKVGVPARDIIDGGQLAVGFEHGLGEGVGSAVDVFGLDGDDLGGSRLEAANGRVINV